MNRTPCSNCQSQDYYASRYRFTKDGTVMTCSECDKQKFEAIPDVYLEGKGGYRTCEALVGRDNKPIPYSTKKEKAAIMKQLCVREVGRHPGSSAKRTFFV